MKRVICLLTVAFGFVMMTAGGASAQEDLKSLIERMRGRHTTIQIPNSKACELSSDACLPQVGDKNVAGIPITVTCGIYQVREHAFVVHEQAIKSGTALWTDSKWLLDGACVWIGLKPWIGYYRVEGAFKAFPGSAEGVVSERIILSSPQLPADWSLSGRVEKLRCAEDPWMSPAAYCGGADMAGSFFSFFALHVPVSTAYFTPAERQAFAAEARQTPHTVEAGGGKGSALPVPKLVPLPGPDHCATYGSLPLHGLKRGQEQSLLVTVKNCGSAAWTSGPASAGAGIGSVILTYHWEKGGKIVPGANHEPVSLAAGATAKVAVKVKAPTQPGTYHLKWDLYSEGKPAYKFSQKGVPPGDGGTCVVK